MACCQSLTQIGSRDPVLLKFSVFLRKLAWKYRKKKHKNANYVEQVIVLWYCGPMFYCLNATQSVLRYYPWDVESPPLPKSRLPTSDQKLQVLSILQTRDRTVPNPYLPQLRSLLWVDSSKVAFLRLIFSAD